MSSLQEPRSALAAGAPSQAISKSERCRSIPKALAHRPLRLRLVLRVVGARVVGWYQPHMACRAFFLLRIFRRWGAPTRHAPTVCRLPSVYDPWPLARRLGRPLRDPLGHSSSPHLEGRLRQRCAPMRAPGPATQRASSEFCDAMATEWALVVPLAGPGSPGPYSERLGSLGHEAGRRTPVCRCQGLGTRQELATPGV